MSLQMRRSKKKQDYCCADSLIPKRNISLCSLWQVGTSWGRPSLFQSCASFKTILDIYLQGGANRSHLTVHRKTNTTGYSFLSFIRHWFVACHCAMSFFVFNQLMYLLLCVHDVYVNHLKYVEVREQLCGMNVLHPPFQDFWGLNLGL